MIVRYKFQPFKLASLLLCTSSDETRYVINGVLVERKDGKLRLVATDGRRLAVHYPDPDDWPRVTKEEPKDFRFIIPRSLLEMLPRHGTQHVPWEMEWDSENAGEIVLHAYDFKIVGKLIEGNYPNWQQVVPSPIPDTFNTDIPVWLNPDFFRDVLSMLWALENLKTFSPRCRDAHGPVVFVCPRTTVVLMPMRVSGSPEIQ